MNSLTINILKNMVLLYKLKKKYNESQHFEQKSRFIILHAKNSFIDP